MPKKVFFSKFYKDWVGLYDILTFKRAASYCPGQNEDICLSIKKSMPKSRTTQVNNMFEPEAATWGFCRLSFNDGPEM